MTIAELAISGVDGADDITIVVHRTCARRKYSEERKRLDEIAALLAVLAVEYIHWQVLDVKADAVAEGQHQNHRHRHDDQYAAQVTADLKNFLPGDGADPVDPHCATSCR